MENEEIDSIQLTASILAAAKEGKTIECPYCKKGTIVPEGNIRTTIFFHCDNPNCKYILRLYCG